MRENVQASQSFASYLLAIILVGILAALWFTGFVLTVLGMASVLSGEPRQWWILLGLFLFGVGFVPAYVILDTRIRTRVAADRSRRRPLPAGVRRDADATQAPRSVCFPRVAIF